MLQKVLKLSDSGAQSLRDVMESDQARVGADDNACSEQSVCEACIFKRVSSPAFSSSGASIDSGINSMMSTRALHVKDMNQVLSKPVWGVRP